MKKAIQTIAKLGLASLVLATAVSCRKDKDHPKEVHSHEEANKMIVSYTEVGTTNTKTVEWVSGEDGHDHGHNHKFAKSEGDHSHEAIDLDNGKSYDVEIKLYHDSEDITSEIKEEGEHHFMEFGFAGVDVAVERSASDEKLGLTTKWTVSSTPTSSAMVEMNLVHEPSTVDHEANNGGGSHTGGEEDVDTTFHID